MDVVGKDGIVMFSDQMQVWDCHPRIWTHQPGKLLGSKGSPKAMWQKSLADCYKTSSCLSLSLTKEANKREADQSGD